MSDAIKRSAELLRAHAALIRDSETDLSGPHQGEIRDADALAEVEEHERLAEQLETFAVSETGTPDPFTLECAEELFGCHVTPEGDGKFICAVCESPINILHWVTAEHSDDCFINQVRAYLAKHKPECVPGVEAK